MSKFKHAKVASNDGPKLSTILLVVAVVFCGALGAKALAAPSEPAEVVTSTPIVVDDGCGGLLTGRGCRIDAAIDAAMK